MKKLVILLGILFLYCNAFSQHRCSKYGSHAKSSAASDTRSDSLDVTHTHISIYELDFSNQLIDAAATINLRAKVDNIQEVDLDLLALTVNEVTLDGAALNFTHENELLRIELGQTYDQDEEFELHITYGGSPEMDDSNWGGFYWNSNFAFNLGVGFDAAPHNFGRAWFPCFDNFVERCTFSFDITTPAPKIAIANGMPDYYGVPDDNGNLLNSWTIEDEIPSYLASMAVGEYDIDISQYYTTDNDSIPMWLAAPESSMNNVTNSFENLPLAVEFFEDFYGPYEWERVGYVFVPFNSGAMEHATNIAYPISFADGSLAFETLMAHELAHHWWGNYVTCSTAEDMWINEGMASYSEALFTEQLYGDDAYYEWITDNHRSIVLTAHDTDNGYLAVSGIGHENTYGTHVYNKGASVGHCLRSYMGDDNFKTACADFMENFALQSVSSADMRDFFQSYTTENLTAFFENWVYNPGFTDFSIDDQLITEINATTYEVELTISQRLHEAPEYFTDMPVVVTLVSDVGEEETHAVLISGAESTVSISTGFNPKHVILNRNYELTPGILAEEKTLTEDGIDSFSYAEFRIDVDAIDESQPIWTRVECHLTGPDEFQSQVEYMISTDRFWRVMGDFNESLDASGRVRYYGSENGLFDFDTEFFQLMTDLNFGEEDIVLLFRPNGHTEWIEHEDYEISFQGSETDFSGRIDFQNLRAGDYTWAYETGEVTLSEKEQVELLIYPNPVSESLIISGTSFEMITYSIIDNSGRIVQMGPIKETSINCKSIAPGNYALQIYNQENKLLETVNFLKN